MKKFIAAAIAVALTTSAQAATFKSWNPPARFDRAYTGRTLYTYGVRNYPLRCWHTAYACTYANYPSVGRCTMYMPYRDEVIAGIKFDLPSWYRLIRHERGHCNGWPGNHPA
jgi:hypothetical protein